MINNRSLLFNYSYNIIIYFPPRNDLYIANVSDKFLSPKHYETHEDLESKLNIDGCVRIIQRYYRAYRIVKFIKESANTYRNLLNQCKLNEEEKILTYKYKKIFNLFNHSKILNRNSFQRSRND